MINKSHFNLLLLLIYCFHTSLLFSEETVDSISSESVQNDNSLMFYDIIWNDTKALGEDALYVGGELISPDLNDMYYLAGITGLTLAGYAMDEDIRCSCLKSDSRYVDNFFEVTNQFGDKGYALIMTGSLYAGGLITGSDDARITARMMFESLIISAYATLTLKMLFGRARPNMEFGRNKFEWFEYTNNYNSFPSGHTTVAFALASVAARKIDTWWAYSLCFSSAAMTGIARIYKDQHWLSDVILGAAIGTVSGFMIVDSEENRQGKKKNGISSNYLIYPTLNGIGISIKL